MTNNTRLIHSPFTLKSLHHSNYIATHDKDLIAWILAVLPKNGYKNICEFGTSKA